MCTVLSCFFGSLSYVVFSSFAAKFVYITVITRSAFECNWGSSLIEKISLEKNDWAMNVLVFRYRKFA